MTTERRGSRVGLVRRALLRAEGFGIRDHGKNSPEALEYDAGSMKPGEFGESLEEARSFARRTRS